MKKKCIKFKDFILIFNFIYNLNKIVRKIIGTLRLTSKVSKKTIQDLIQKGFVLFSVKMVQE